MLGDRGRAAAVEPKALASLRADGDESLAALAVRHAHDIGGGRGHRIGVVADDVADQHHLRERVALRFRGVTDGAQVALVEVFQAGQDRAAALGRLEQVVLDFDDARNRIARLAEELEANGARMSRHLVQHPARRRDEPVAAFLLHAGQARQEFVGDVLAEPFLAKAPAFDRKRFGTQQPLAGRCIAVEPLEFEARHVDIVNLAAVVFEPRHFEPIALRIDHPPPGEVIERRAPQHRLLAARVHRDVAADARRVERGRVHGEHVARGLGRLRHAARDDAGAREDRRHFRGHAGQLRQLNGPKLLELFRVDDGRERRERDRAARVAGTAPARDHRQPKFEARRHEPRDLRFRVRRQHDERVLDAPIGRVGDVRHAREAVEANVVLLRAAAEHFSRSAAQIGRRAEFRRECLDGTARGNDEHFHARGALERGLVAMFDQIGPAALLDLAQAVVQRLDQQGAALGVVEQVVLQIRIAAHDPDIAQHFVEHPGGAARAALRAQAFERLPRFIAEQSDDDLAIGKRRVVVRNLAQARFGIGGGSRGAVRIENLRCVHGRTDRWAGQIVDRRLHPAMRVTRKDF